MALMVIMESPSEYIKSGTDMNESKDDYDCEITKARSYVVTITWLT